MSDLGLWRAYTPPGPKAAGWLFSDAEMAFVIGPYGSAKTSTGSQKCMRVTCQQHPSTKDGARKALITAVRPNYRRMNDTLVQSVKAFFGKDGQWTGATNGPQDFHLRWTERDDKFDMKIWFRAFGDEAIESFVRGFQPTAWWVSEFDELPQGALSKMASRAGRYLLEERPDMPPPAYCKVFGDANMPDLDNWAHEFLLNPSRVDPNVEIFLQPSGFSPQAENMAALRRISPTYYEDMAQRFRADGDASSVKRFIENVAGYTPHGKPVYPMFQAGRHIANGPLQASRLRRLTIGVDQGGQAAAVITQPSGDGVLSVLREVVLQAGEFYGGEEFGRLLAFRLRQEFPHFCRKGGFRIVMDPAAMQRHSASRENNPRAWSLDFIDGLQAEGEFGFEIDWDLAPTNSIAARTGSVKKLLMLPGISAPSRLIVDPAARVLIRGFAGGYRYAPVQGKPGEYHPEPDKNHYSNIHDALQYAALECVPEFAEAAAADTSDEKRLARILAPQGEGWSPPVATEIVF